MNKFVQIKEIMQLFYTYSIDGDFALFSQGESTHCLRVLRMHVGDTISFTDGKGNLYEGTIIHDDPNAMKVAITTTISGYGQRKYRLHIAISPLKNEDRFEWFIEKAVEIGIDEITPLICNRTEKKRFRRERLEALILSAMKQSVKTFLPHLSEPITMTDFLAKAWREKKIIACCDSELERQAITEAVSGKTDIVIMIGPEGDFTDEETRLAISAGFTPVHMGPARLRTETAGIAACCSVYLASL